MRDGLGSLARWGPTAYDNLRNGKLRYRPDLTGPLAERGAAEADNARFDVDAGAIKPDDPAKPAAVTWRFASPYVFVGGSAYAVARLGDGASVEWRYTTDRQTWQTLATLNEPGTSTFGVDLDEIVSPRRRPTYEFWLQLTLKGDVEAKEIAFDNDVQTSALSLPELEAGTNRIAYTDANAQDRRVRITHRWLERRVWHPPEAPRQAIAPEDGQTVLGSRVAFEWAPAKDPDGDRVVDYHFELSEHADMRWPLSPNFEKLTSLTPSRGKPRWTVPYVGLLNPDTVYYWRARARDESGLWGPWSRTFRFQVKAPGVPLDLELVPEGEAGFALRWQPNAQGESPVAYKVYGSDERGFTASDTEYLVNRGKGFVRTMEEYEAKPSDAPDAGMVRTPGNLIARVAETSLRVVGPGLELPNTNRAYYRVVAVDAPGNESGPSDYVEVTRPFVVVEAQRKAKVGERYRDELQVIGSLGDLRCRRSPKSSYNAAFWDREEHTFTATGLPEGLSIDAQTGVISGTPQQSGTFDAAVQVSDQFGKSRTVSYRLVVEGS
jgi:hypothetical protein